MTSSSGMIRNFLLVFFFASTPITQYFVLLGKDRMTCAIANGYAFSIPMVLMYIYPYFQSRPMSERIKAATINWVIWLSVFTEIIFQIPHNLFVKQLNDIKGSSIEWPFYSYGLSDSRWDNYHNGDGLAPEVWLINANDAFLGIIVLTAMLYYKANKSSLQNGPASKVIFVLVVIFRDATLWRETVEYMFDHHRKGYPYTTVDPVYRSHAIAILWIVNGVWLIAPIVSIVWGFNEITSLFLLKKKQT